MKIIHPSAEIIDVTPNALYKIELCGRVCYKSEDRMTKGSSSKFIEMLIARGHESVLEHASASIRFITNRGVSHELVRHRIASFSQESTRYVNYSNGKHGETITYIWPSWILNVDKNVAYSETSCSVLFSSNDAHDNNILPMSVIWEESLRKSEWAYFELLKLGMTPQHARGVLQNDLKTEVVITANFREWRTIFKQRMSKAAHPDMRIVMSVAFNLLNDQYSEIFNEFKKDAV